jgi:hypothetical protein
MFEIISPSAIAPAQRQRLLASGCHEQRHIRRAARYSSLAPCAENTFPL